MDATGGVDLVELAGTRGRLAEDVTVDPATAEVIRGAMETVCWEMATYVSRTATTPILNQSNERNGSILDARGRLAALSVGIPPFMLSSALPTRVSLGYLGDLRAQIRAAQLAARRLGEIIERYGTNAVEESVDYMIDYASRRFREE